jgi:hypothetical protein
MAALAESQVTQTAQISQISLRCYACRGADVVFIGLLAALTEAAEVGLLPFVAIRYYL